jgi:hypothetical protein
MVCGRTSSPLLDSRLARPIAQMRSTCAPLYTLIAVMLAGMSGTWNEDIVSNLEMEEGSRRGIGEE